MIRPQGRNAFFNQKPSDQDPPPANPQVASGRSRLHRWSESFSHRIWPKQSPRHLIRPKPGTLLAPSATLRLENLDPYLIRCLLDYCSPEQLLVFAVLNKSWNAFVKREIDDYHWLLPLKRDIGPVIDRLIQSGEKWEDAYCRHRRQIKALLNPAAANEKDDFNLFYQRLQQYPHYHPDKLIHPKRLYRLLHQIPESLNGLCSHLTTYPDSNAIVMQQVLSNPELFLRFFKSSHQLIQSREKLPQYWSQIMAWVLKNDEVFIALFKPKNFNPTWSTTDFPSYGQSLLNKLCASKIIYTQVIPDENRFHSLTEPFSRTEQNQLKAYFKQYHGHTPKAESPSPQSALQCMVELRQYLPNRQKNQSLV